MKIQLTKHNVFQLIAFLIALFCMKNALWIVWLIYGACFFVLWLLFHRRLMFLSALFMTALVVFFAMPQVLSGMHYTFGAIHRLLASKPVLLYDGQMKRKPVVSIIVPAYNYENYVGKALNSAATQDFALPYEVVVVDDGSKDNTLNVLLKEAKKYKHVRIYANKKNQGVITTKNSAIDLARGEWIFNLDADDWIEPDALLQLFKTQQESNAGATYTWFIYEGAKHGVEPLCAIGTIFSENCVPNCFFYRKSDWRKYGGYSYLFTKGFEDWAFWLKFAEHGIKIVRTPVPVYHYLVKEKSRQEALNTSRQNDEDNSEYMKVWWFVQAWYIKRFEWHLRLLFSYTGFDVRKIRHFDNVLKQMEIARFRNFNK